MSITIGVPAWPPPMPMWWRWPLWRSVIRPVVSTCHRGCPIPPKSALEGGSGVWTPSEVQVLAALVVGEAAREAFAGNQRKRCV